MFLYLSLDISLVSTGFVVVNSNKELLDFGFIEAPSPKKKDVDRTTDYIRKINFQVSKINEILEKYSVKEVFIENFSFGSFGGSRAVSALTETAGVIKRELFNRNIPFVLISPQTAKKHVTGSGKAKKEDVYRAVVEKYPQLLNSRYDVTDAMAIALTSIEK